jgi:hypothetical protein
MPRDARDHEHHAALDGGVDGLDVLRRVAAEAPVWLRRGGRLVVETGRDQADRMAADVSTAGMSAAVETDDDVGGMAARPGVAALGGPRWRPPGGGPGSSRARRTARETEPLAAVLDLLPARQLEGRKFDPRRVPRRCIQKGETGAPEVTAQVSGGHPGVLAAVAVQGPGETNRRGPHEPRRRSGRGPGCQPGGAPVVRRWSRRPPREPQDGRDQQHYEAGLPRPSGSRSPRSPSGRSHRRRDLGDPDLTAPACGAGERRCRHRW